MIQYILSSLFFCMLVLLAYIKIKYPFWNIQPVFHSYDYWRFFNSIPYVIYKYRPVKTKYCDFQQIETTNYSDCSLSLKNEMINLLQCHYIPSEKILHTITVNDIDTIFTGINGPSYISLFYDKIIQTEGEQGINVLINPVPSGCVTSRSYTMFYRPTLSETTYMYDVVYFIDYLCVSRERDRKKLNRVLLQTHEYNQRVNNPNVLISLLKKEIDLFEGVIPLVKYNTLSYYIPPIHSYKLPPEFQVVPIESNNIHILTDYLYSLTHTSYNTVDSLFDMCILQETSYYLSQIKAGLVHIYCLRHKEHVYGIYFFKNTYTEYEDIEGSMLMFSTSIKNINNNEVFYTGFLNSLFHLLKKNKKYKMLLVENIGHNQYVLQYWSLYNKPIFNTSSAYYLYNFIYPSSPLLSNRTLIFT